MKCITSRLLDRFPIDLITVADSVVALTSRDDEPFLEAYDARLAPLWSKRLESTAVALFTVNRTPWILDSDGAWACGDEGKCLVRVAARHPHADARWEPRPMERWIPSTWFSTSRTLPVSGDALLACFSDIPRSGIGFGYVVSLIDGALRFTTQAGPISEVAPVGSGRAGKGLPLLCPAHRHTRCGLGVIVKPMSPKFGQVVSEHDSCACWNHRDGYGSQSGTNWIKKEKK